MNLKKLYDPKDGQMRVVGLMSGSGTNLEKIIEFERELKIERGESPFKVAVIFTDTFNSNAPKMGKDYDIPVVVRDIKGFYAARGKPRRDMGVRAEFDSETVKALAPYEVSVAAYAGYMSISTKPLINAFLGVNVHPADLSIMVGGKRRYTGAHAVKDAILAGEKHIRSTTHLIEEKVDYGRILMISPSLEVVVNLSTDENQERLKERGDWVVFPRTLLYIAEGRYSEDFNGSLYFDGETIPDGVFLEE